MDVLKISDHIVGRLCGEIERHRAGESASVKIRGRIGELPAAAFDDGIGAKAAKLKRRKREFSDRKNAAGAQPRRHLPRLRRGSEEREEAPKEIVAALRIKPAVHANGAQIVRRESEFPFSGGSGFLQRAAPIGGKSVCGNETDFIALRRKDDRGLHGGNFMIQEWRGDFEAVECDCAGRGLQRWCEATVRRKIAFRRAVKSPARRQAEAERFGCVEERPYVVSAAAELPGRMPARGVLQ